MSINEASLTEAEFHELWRKSGERDDEPMLTTAWRRYQQLQESPDETSSAQDYVSIDELRTYFEPLLHHHEVEPLWENHIYLNLPANTLPWKATGIIISDDQPISVLAVGRTWRSRLLDMFLPPQFNLWFRIGMQGSIFNSTHDTKSFKCIANQGGELYVANQFPGGFHDKVGGRVGGKLSVYDRAQGEFNLVVIQWNQGIPIPSLIDTMQRMSDISYESRDHHSLRTSDPGNLLATALERMNSDYFTHMFPSDWKLLWFLGVSEIFYREREALQADEANEIIRCVPNHNVGILQKDLADPVPLREGMTASWSWNIIALPSRLREDTSISHDYLSIAFEFENGRDLTYLWSWELPVGFGFWCPLDSWCDREYHVVIRSAGIENFGKWFDESRDVHADYVKYINEGDVTRPVPSQIVRVWLIAGNRWQRHHGEMLIKSIQLQSKGREIVEIL